MKSGRVVVSLHYTQQVETAPDVDEFQETIVPNIKAVEQFIFQQRIDQAFADGMPLTRRFEIREHYVNSNLDYIICDNIQYKVRQITPSVNNHTAIVEVGEQMGVTANE